MLSSCSSFTVPATSLTDTMGTAVGVTKTAVIETQIVFPTNTSAPPSSTLPTFTPSVETNHISVSFDSHEPEAVLRAYFDAWNRNDWDTMTYLESQRVPEPVEFVHILEIQQISSSETECVYSVLFEIKVKGQGGSMHNGQYPWNYYLTWDENRDTWYISNYGFG